MIAASQTLQPPSLSPQPAAAGAPELIRDALDHYRRMTTMLERLDRLPELAQDIRNWRPRDSRRLFPGEATPLEPVARHALDAVASGLAMLGVAAATLCETDQGRLTAEEIGVCREIGAAMTSLLERAKALLWMDEAGGIAERTQIRRSFSHEDASEFARCDGINLY